MSMEQELRNEFEHNRQLARMEAKQRARELAPVGGSASRPTKEQWNSALAQLTDEQVEALYREVCRSIRIEKKQNPELSGDSPLQ